MVHPYHAESSMNQDFSLAAADFKHFMTQNIFSPPGLTRVQLHSAYCFHCQLNYFYYERARVTCVPSADASSKPG